jgi:2-polyprenyl-3-methyl-5-hydroxy-6-metoxy-1,4-benzoquinol methylase
MNNNYGIRPGYDARTSPAYFHDVRSDNKHWQPQVIPIAAHYARKLKARRLIDIGCGRGYNLEPYSAELSIIGVDYGANVDYCRSTYDFGRWLECDLEHNTPDIECHDLNQSVIVCADVIEHLQNPERLILSLSMMATCAALVVLSTPDRERVYGHNHAGPPGNPHHVREWTLAELAAWIQGYPLRVQWAGWTLNNDVDRQLSTSLLLLTRREICYTISNIESVFEVEAAR